MAAMFATRRTSRLLQKLLDPARSAAARPLTTSAAMRNFSYDDDERAVDAARRRGRDPFVGFFPDAVEPFYPARSLSQVLNLMDQVMETPAAVAASSRGVGLGGGFRRGWDARVDGGALYLRMEMPGLGKEHVKVSLEQNTLVIRGEGEKEPGEAEAGVRYSSWVDLQPEVYRLDQIRGEMKNGVLKVVVPKKVEEGRKDVVQIQIE